MKRILVVDDRTEFRRLYESLARGNDREVVCAASAREAIQLIRESTFDLVITDLQMERDDSGIDVLESARGHNPPAEVIVVTRYGTPEISKAAMDKGAFDYLKQNYADVDFQAMLPRKIEQALRFAATQQAA